MAIERAGADAETIDLDTDAGAPDSGLLPSTTCRIIENIVNNAVHLRDRLETVVAAVGEGKCDRGRHAAHLLRAMGIEVVESRFGPEDFEKRPLVYSVARMPLREKIDAIMGTVVDPGPPTADPPLTGPPAGGARSAVPLAGKPSACDPTHGFWGVPPNDFRILDLFPGTTHVYGWTRCVEAGRPSDLALEMFVDEGVPTVFFTQSFCAKQDLAHYLAERYKGIAIDCHREINDSILAKVEAFIRLA